MVKFRSEDLLWDIFMYPLTGLSNSSRPFYPFLWHIKICEQGTMPVVKTEAFMSAMYGCLIR